MAWLKHTMMQQEITQYTQTYKVSTAPSISSSTSFIRQQKWKWFTKNTPNAKKTLWKIHDPSGFWHHNTTLPLTTYQLLTEKILWGKRYCSLFHRLSNTKLNCEAKALIMCIVYSEILSAVVINIYRQDYKISLLYNCTWHKALHNA